MEDIIKELAPPTITKTIEPELPTPSPEPTGGFPWCGTGVVVLVVAAALLGRKFCACKKK